MVAVVARIEREATRHARSPSVTGWSVPNGTSVTNPDQTVRVSLEGRRITEIGVHAALWSGAERGEVLRMIADTINDALSEEEVATLAMVQQATDASSVVTAAGDLQQQVAAAFARDIDEVVASVARKAST